MLKLLASLFALMNKLFDAWNTAKMREEGRKQVEEKLDENVRKAADAVANPDTARDERLRNKFDRSRRGK